MTHENFLHAILPHASEPHILVMPTETGWTLPRFQSEGVSDDDFDLYEHGMHSGALMGCKTATLYCTYFERKSEDYRRFVFVLENRDSAFQTPEGARWVNAGEFASLALAHAYVRRWSKPISMNAPAASTRVSARRGHFPAGWTGRMRG